MYGHRNNENTPSKIISPHWESNHFFPRKLLRLLDFVSCSSPMSMSFISSCLSFLVCLKALDFKVAISKGATAAASEWSLGQGFCVLNFLSWECRYRVSQRLVLTFDFYSWLFWWSYQKNLTLQFLPKWFNLIFATLIFTKFYNFFTCWKKMTKNKKK